MGVIRYETADGVEEVESEFIDYDNDSSHWVVKVGETDDGENFAYIPRKRVYDVTKHIESSDGKREESGVSFPES